MIFKKTAWVLIALIMFATTVAYAQDMPVPRNEERWKQLQSMRVWTIIQQLKLDARSEHGITILDTINKNADTSRDFLLEKQEKMRLLHTALRSSSPDESLVTTLIEDIEELHRQILQSQLAYQEKLGELLTPVERAKLFIAEEVFRQRLRRAMHGGPGGRKGPGQGNEKPVRKDNKAPRKQGQGK